MSEGFENKVQEIIHKAYFPAPDGERLSKEAADAITTLHESDVGRLNGDTLVLNQARVDAIKERDALRLTIKELRQALKPFAGFMMTAEPGEYMRDSVNARIEWHDTERAREALARVKESHA